MARRREIPWSRSSGQRRDAFEFYRVKKPATDEYYRTMHGCPPVQKWLDMAYAENETLVEDEIDWPGELIPR